MQNPSKAGPGVASASAAAATLFRQAASAGRDSLNHAELDALLSAMAIGFEVVTAPAAKPPAVEVRISLNYTREFGMVLSAGLGGLDAQLDEANFRKDRASVYAAAELTDAADFLRLFRRTLAYQKLESASRRSKTPLPDERLKACFARMLALASDYSSADPGAPFMLRALELDPVQLGG